MAVGRKSKPAGGVTPKRRGDVPSRGESPPYPSNAPKCVAPPKSCLGIFPILLANSSGPLKVATSPFQRAPACPTSGTIAFHWNSPAVSAPHWTRTAKSGTWPTGCSSTPRLRQPTPIGGGDRPTLRATATNSALTRRMTLGWAKTTSWATPAGAGGGPGTLLQLSARKWSIHCITSPCFSTPSASV